MGSLSNYAENKILDHIVGKTSFTMPSIYLALWTDSATIDDASTGSTANEVSTSGTSYARKSTSGSDWEAAASGAIQNAGAITFTTATGSWGTVKYVALVDNATAGAGNIIAWAQLGTNKAITTGDTASFAAGDIDITLD
jgi:hypothetical protein